LNTAVFSRQHINPCPQIDRIDGFGDGNNLKRSSGPKANQHKQQTYREGNKMTHLGWNILL
jgi:hypothetical protein